MREHIPGDGKTILTLKHSEITEKVLHAFFKEVYPKLGYGFLEKAYENALIIVLRRMGLQVQQQARILVHFEGQVVGEYYADLLVEDKVIVELKVASIEQSDLDLFRYQLLRSKFSGNLAGSWYEAWDELESSGKLVPLLIYTGRIAVRNDIVNLRVRPDGFPDFANCWILQKP
jgi:GxxExxY protein